MSAPTDDNLRRTKILRLGREWHLGARIGGGGFGVVFRAESGGLQAAVKLVPKAPGAERELLFVDLKDARNVVPIIDSGETEDTWALVMPLATQSLREYMDANGDAQSVDHVVRILKDVATALADLDGTVVHRDLKPENILLVDGIWCLADFGISRYAEATTAPDTRKHALSPPYAAPERWRSERATAATDVYSLGVVAYELLSGRRPFDGPTLEAFRDQHLHVDPEALEQVPPSFAALIDECLYKAPGARPSAANILARLERIPASQVTVGLSRLQEANREEVNRRARTARAESETQTEAERRASLMQAADKGLGRIGTALEQAIALAAPAAPLSSSRNRDGWSMRLGVAEMSFTGPRASTPSSKGWENPPFDVVSYASVSVRIRPDRFGYEGRSHSLWYCDAQDLGRYAWFETAFMISPLIARQGRQDPFALEPGEQSSLALGGAIAEFQVAWPFAPIAAGETEEFVDRWAGWLAEAAQGALRHPSSMPEKPPAGSWRRGA
jgi:eukaryotic-like serine/threonine-protein kinase